MLLKLLGRTQDEEFWATMTDEQVVIVARGSPSHRVQLDRDHVVGLVSREPGPRTQRSRPTPSGSPR
ncbi:MAG: hypothetical protein U0133_04380 [Gemmatimonadales bacterium]